MHDVFTHPFVSMSQFGAVFISIDGAQPLSTFEVTHGCTCTLNVLAAMVVPLVKSLRSMKLCLIVLRALVFKQSVASLFVHETLELLVVHQVV